MPVNGGTGNAISLSEVQTFYGGSNPISMSEYYRGGSEVPDAAVGAASASGTASNTTSNIAVVVTTGSTSSTISGTHIVGTQTVDTGTAGGATTTLTWGNSQNEGSVGLEVNGTYVGGVGESTTTTATVSDGDTFRVFVQSGDGFGIWSYTRLTTAYDMTITNNTGQTVDMTMSPWSDDSSFTNGEVATANGQASNSWSWSHPAVTGTGNTNVPTSGVISLDTFNDPGTPAP